MVSIGKATAVTKPMMRPLTDRPSSATAKAMNLRLDEWAKAEGARCSAVGLRIPRLLAAMCALIGVIGIATIASSIGSHVAVGAATISGEIYVANGFPNPPEGNTITTYPLPISASSPSSTVADPAGNGTLNDINGIAFDGSNDLWASNPVMGTLAELTGSQLAASGSKSPNVTIAGVSALQAGLAFDLAGDLWFSQGTTIAELTPAQLASDSNNPTPAVTISGLAQTQGLAFDSSGDLWIAGVDGSVVEFTPSQLASGGSPTPTTTISTGAAFGVAFDGSGDLWTSTGSALVEFTPSQLASGGSPTPTTTITESLSLFSSPTFDSSGDLWVNSSGVLQEFTPSQLATSGSPTPNVTITSTATGAMAFDPGSGFLWTGGSAFVLGYAPSDLVSSMSPISPTVAISSPAGPLDQPRALTLDNSGDLWVSNSLVLDTIDEYTPGQLASGGTPTPNVVLSGVEAPSGLVFDGAGDLWVSTPGVLEEFSPTQLDTSANPAPVVAISVNTTEIAFDPSGDLWYSICLLSGCSINELTPSQLAASGGPTPSVSIVDSETNDVSGIAFDSSGDLWASGGSALVEYASNQLATSGSPDPSVAISGEAASATSIAFDAAGDLWLVGRLLGSLGQFGTALVEYTPSQLASSGSPTPTTTISGASSGLDDPDAIAIKSSVTEPTPPPAPPGSTSSTSGSGSGAVTATNDLVTATASGSGALTVAQYGADPGPVATFGSVGEYFDVALSLGDSFSSLVIQDCNLSGGSSLDWLDGSNWEPVVGDPGPTFSGGSPPCVSVTLSSSTSPTLSQLTGTVFAVSKASSTQLTQIYGSDAIGTSIAISEAAFPTAGSAGAVVLARDDFFSDALAGGPLAAAVGGPMLLTEGAPESANLDPRTQAEIQRVLPVGGTVYVLGGDLALNANLDTTLKGLGYTVVREAGADEYATAVDIAQQLGNPSTIFEATGLNFPDALSADPAAITRHGAILLTDGTQQSLETYAYLVGHPGDARYAIGGPLAAAGADAGATAVYGQDLYGTSAAVASFFFPGARVFGVATGLNFPDALGGGVYMATGGRVGPLLLVDPSASPTVPTTIAAYLATLAVNTTGDVFGGPLAVPANVIQAIESDIG